MPSPTWLIRRMEIPCLIYQRVPAGVDEYGNVTYDEVEFASKCFIQPLTQNEIQGGTAQQGLYMIHLPTTDFDVGIASGFSRIVVRGYSMEIIGSPGVYFDLCGGAMHHIELTAQFSTA